MINQLINGYRRLNGRRNQDRVDAFQYLISKKSSSAEKKKVMKELLRQVDSDQKTVMSRARKKLLTQSK